VTATTLGALIAATVIFAVGVLAGPIHVTRSELLAAVGYVFGGTMVVIVFLSLMGVGPFQGETITLDEAIERRKARIAERRERAARRRRRRR
jgi:hypothetical protein